jgi:DNA repair protein RecN
MLSSLTVSNYILIDNLEVEFPEGLIIVTGETGAGKSILIGALNLLLGAKADSSVIKDSSKNCVVEGVFCINDDLELSTFFNENSLDFSSEITLRRVISPYGKSRSFVNDEPVSLQFLKELSGQLIDIHAQHQQLLLSDSRFQLSVLDSFAGNGELLDSYRKEYYLLKEHEKERDLLIEKIGRFEQESEYNTHQLNQLEAAKLTIGELEEMEAEFKLLSHAEEIKLSIVKILQLLNPPEASFVQNLKEISSISSKLLLNFPAIEPISQRIENSRIEIRDIEQELQIFSESISVSPEKMVLVEQRISVIYDLLNKHHLSNVEQLIEFRDSLRSKLSSSESSKEELSELEERISLLRKNLKECAERLSSKRIGSARQFSNSLTSRIRNLEMPHAIFDLKLEKTTDYGPFGCDTVEFIFSANSNVAPKNLSSIASGGELSRIMLCLKAIMAKGIGMPTMIFDEIDSGVSGSIADKMGNLIDELSQNMQIFAITHLPQIASKGNHHLLVYKEVNISGDTESKIVKIEGEARITEIARMLSGSELTNEAVENARVFLKR